MKILVIVSVLLIIFGSAYYFTRPKYKVGPITMTISMNQENADYLLKTKNEMKIFLTIKSRHDDPTLSLFNLVHDESLHPVGGAQFQITLPKITTSRSVGSYFAPYWIRLDIINSSIDQGDISRMTCFPKGQNKSFTVLDRELMPSDIESGEIFKDFHIDVECTVIEDEK
jgi:hypothetical protein